MYKCMNIYFDFNHLSLNVTFISKEKFEYSI